MSQTDQNPERKRVEEKALGIRHWAQDTLRSITFSLVVSLCLFIAPADAQNKSPTDVQSLRDQAKRAMATGDYAPARDALEELLGDDPHNPNILYDLAAAQAQLGAIDLATDRLIDALSNGFVDFRKMERDHRLEPIRTSRQYHAIILGWRRLLDARADANIASLKKLLGGGYHYDRDERLRLLYASAFNERSFEVAQEEIERISTWAFATLFREPAQNDPKPDAWVTVLLPTPEHFFTFMIKLGAGPNVGGLYDNNRSQLICQDIGPSLRHEFLHVLHWRTMSRLGQHHPDWIMEGLGALVEDMDPAPDSPTGTTPAASWRTNIAKRLARIGSLMPLDDLMTMDPATFRRRRPNANYAQARAFMLFMNEQGVLSEWFTTYLNNYTADPTGRAAVERAFQAPLPEIERRYRDWLEELPMAPERIKSGMASLGVMVAAGRGDGPVIDETVSTRGARRSGLRLGDVILSIDGRSTRTLPGLVRVLSQYEIGQRVNVEVRRGKRRLTLEVELIER